jgi:two-component system sensor histidine kinase AlgZ
MQDAGGAEAPQPVPLDSLWRRDAVLAIALAGAAIALALALAPGAREDMGARFLFLLLLVEWVAAGTLFVLFSVRERVARLSPRALAAVALVSLLANTLVVGTVAWSVGQELTPYMGGIDAFLARLTAVALCIGLLGLAVFRLHWQARRLALSAKHAELQALRARIHPHFLFNSLNTAIALVRARPDAAEAVLLDLADLFRAALDAPRDVPLAHELAMVLRYLEIEKLRLGDRLRIEWDVPVPPPAAVVPSLSIQPLAENAVRHGIEPSPAGGCVSLRVACAGDRVVMELSNPLPEPRGTRPGHQVGLTSARERIAASGQSDARLETREEDGRFVVRIELPLLGAHVTTR